MGILGSFFSEKKNILVVDDDKNILRLLELLTQSAFKVVTVSDSAMAEEMVAKGIAFDAFLLDVMMPRISGVDLARKIRAKSRKPIVFMSGKLTPGDSEDLADSVSNCHVFRKPFNCVEMLAKLKQLTGAEKTPVEVG